MSSPLKAFRKHQKKLIVIFGVLLMVSFTVLASVQQYLTPGSPGQEAGEEVIATWKHGEITRADIQRKYIDQQSAGLFMSALVDEAAKNGGQPQVELLRGDGSDLWLVRQIILARKAEDMGVVIDDDTITQYLAKLTDDSKRSSEQFEGLFEHHMKDRRMNYKGFLRYMKQALLAENMYSLGTAGLSGDVLRFQQLGVPTPGEAKSLHDRIYRYQQVEMLPYKVDDYLSKVTGQPSESKTEELYEAGEDRYSTPTSAEPGFRRRHKIEFAYFAGDVEAFRKLEEAKITDEQIAKYYEEHKEDFKRASLPSDLGSGSTGESDLPGTTIKPIGLPKLDLNTPPKKNSETDKENDDPKGTSKDNSSGEASSKDDSRDKSTEKDLKEKGSDSSDDQSRIDARFDEPTLFVSLDDEASVDKGTEEEKSTTAEGSEEDKSSPDKATNDEKPAAPGTEVPPEKGGEKVENKQPDKDSEAGSSETEKVEPKSEYKPLDEVKDQIRSTLAVEAVSKEFEGSSKFNKREPFHYLRDRALTNVATSVRKYYRERNRWVAYEEQGKPDAKKPVEPDWEKLAAEYNLKYGKTPLVDLSEVGDTEIGKLKSEELDLLRRQQLTRSFAEYGFDKEEKLFNTSEFPPINKGTLGPNTSVFYQNSGDVRYLYWKAAEAEENTPPLSKIRSEVVRAWKTQQARKLALADAKKGMTKIESSDASLIDVFGEESVQRPRGFTWLSTGGGNIGLSRGQQLSISEVEGVEMPGMKFHEAVAEIEQGEVGIAMNQDESVVYLVRVDDASMLNDFTSVNPQILQLARLDQVTVFRNWLKEVEDELEVEWKGSDE